MAEAKRKKLSLLEAVRQTVPKQRGFPSWFDKLDPATQRELETVKQAFLSGGLPQHGKSSLHQAVKEALKLGVSRCAFVNWLDKPHGAH